MSPALEIQGLSKTYKTHFWDKPMVGLHGLDLQVERGEVFGFIGPNGAGKTTTIKILMGLQAATSGSARILGVDHVLQESREKVGFLPERPYFYQHLTAMELLDMYGALCGLDSGLRRRRIGELLERVDLTHVTNTPLKAFSKGMLQRIGLAQALLNDPEVLILDEPTAAIDAKAEADIFAHFRELTANRISIIISPKHKGLIRHKRVSICCIIRGYRSQSHGY